MPEIIDQPFITNGYVYTVMRKTKTPLNPREYATMAAALQALKWLNERVPETGPFKIYGEYEGNGWNPFLYGPGEEPVGNDPKLIQLSIMRVNSATPHNAGLLYLLLSTGSSIPLDEFRAEAGL